MMPSRRSGLSGVAFAAFIVLAAVGAFALGKQKAEGPNDQVPPPARGLPHTADYHSLYVDPKNPRRLLLGTHVGMYESRDGGATWKTGPLAGDDAMNIVGTPDGALWVAGHNVLARSEDDGVTWTDVRPDGLPSLDLHGFASDSQGKLYAAAAGSGLYSSTDGGRTFTEISDDVGGGVYGLLALDGGRLLGADPGRGVLLSEDSGATWQVALRAPVIRLGASSGASGVVLAMGERVWRSEDGGRSWSEGFSPGPTFEPVAWSPSAPNVVFVIVPQTRTLYRSDDAGKTWKPVT
jgi:photosystem II stability/assembly factor-like uncharacterized protein